MSSQPTAKKDICPGRQPVGGPRIGSRLSKTNMPVNSSKILVRKEQHSRLAKCSSYKYCAHTVLGTCGTESALLSRRAAVCSLASKMGALSSMFWAFVAAAGTGMVLGLWMRLHVYVVLVASAATVLACAALAPLTNWSLSTGMVCCVGLVTTLQMSYLAGSALSCALSRAGSWSVELRAMRASLGNLAGVTATTDGPRRSWPATRGQVPTTNAAHSTGRKRCPGAL